MENKRFLRSYKLTVTTETGSVIISDPLKISFSCNKSISGGLNSSTINIYNIAQKSRELISKERFQTDKRIKVTLDVGYGDRSETIFKGTVLSAISLRDGADIVTEIEATDGGEALEKSFVTKVIDAGVDKVEEIVDELTGVAKGKVTAKVVNTRPIVIVGNAVEELRKASRENGYIFYIGEEKCHVIKSDEVIFEQVQIVKASTGLINTPTREGLNVVFNTVLNPAIKVGGKVKVESEVDKRDAKEGGVNGIYVVTSMNIQGDNYGDLWNQTITAKPFGVNIGDGNAN